MVLKVLMIRILKKNHLAFTEENKWLEQDFWSKGKNSDKKGRLALWWRLDGRQVSQQWAATVSSALLGIHIVGKLKKVREHQAWIKRREDQTGKMPQIQTKIAASVYRAWTNVRVLQRKFVVKKYLNNLFLLLCKGTLSFRLHRGKVNSQGKEVHWGTSKRLENSQAANQCFKPLDEVTLWRLLCNMQLPFFSLCDLYLEFLLKCSRKHLYSRLLHLIRVGKDENRVQVLTPKWMNYVALGRLHLYKKVGRWFQGFLQFETVAAEAHKCLELNFSQRQLSPP